MAKFDINGCFREAFLPDGVHRVDESLGSTLGRIGGTVANVLSGKIVDKKIHNVRRWGSNVAGEFKEAFTDISSAIRKSLEKIANKCGNSVDKINTEVSSTLGPLIANGLSGKGGVPSNFTINSIKFPNGSKANDVPLAWAIAGESSFCGVSSGSPVDEAKYPDIETLLGTVRDNINFAGYLAGAPEHYGTAPYNDICSWIAAGCGKGDVPPPDTGNEDAHDNEDNKFKTGMIALFQAGWRPKNRDAFNGTIKLICKKLYSNSFAFLADNKIVTFDMMWYKSNCELWGADPKTMEVPDSKKQKVSESEADPDDEGTLDSASPDPSNVDDGESESDNPNVNFNNLVKKYVSGNTNIKDNQLLGNTKAAGTLFLGLKKLFDTNNSLTLGTVIASIAHLMKNAKSSSLKTSSDQLTQKYEALKKSNINEEAESSAQTVQTQGEGGDKSTQPTTATPAPVAGQEGSASETTETKNGGQSVGKKFVESVKTLVSDVKKFFDTITKGCDEKSMDTFLKSQKSDFKTWEDAKNAVVGAIDTITPETVANEVKPSGQASATGANAGTTVATPDADKDLEKIDKANQTLKQVSAEMDKNIQTPLDAVRSTATSSSDAEKSDDVKQPDATEKK